MNFLLCNYSHGFLFEAGQASCGIMSS